MKKQKFPIFLAALLLTVLIVQPSAGAGNVYANDSASAAPFYDPEEALIAYDPEEVLIASDIPPAVPGEAEIFASANQAFVNEVVRLVNVERKKNNLPLLAGWYPALNDAADLRARETIQRTSHTRPNGTDCFTVFPEFGVVSIAGGENIAGGQTSPGEVVRAWMNSAGHRANILNPSFNYLGVGYAYNGNTLYRHYWAQLFAWVPNTPSTAVTLSQSSLKVKLDKTASLTAAMTPLHSTDYVVWSTDNTEAVLLTPGGAFDTTCALKGLAEGTATVTATSRTGVSASCVVDVILEPYNISNIQGILPPVRGKAPSAGITPTAQYTGTLSWSPEITGGVFDGGTQYTATITLAPKTGYGSKEVPANFFRIIGASSVSNAADSGVITAVFPPTAASDVPVNLKNIPLAAPAAGAPPVTYISADQYTARVSWSPSVPGAFSGTTAYTAKVTLTPKPGFTMDGVTEDFFEAPGSESVSYSAGSSVVTAVYPSTGFAPASSFSVSPSHAILAKKNDFAVISAVLPPQEADYGKITWYHSVNDNIEFSHPHGNASIMIELTSDAFPAETVTAWAVYSHNGIDYTAAATVELLPAGEAGEATTVSLLENKVTVNKARLVGTRLPVLITEQPGENFGIQSFSDPVIGGVKLFTKDKASGEWTVPLTAFEARMCPTDSHYIEIDALEGAKNEKNVKVKLLPFGKTSSADDADWIEADRTVDLSVTEKYPKVTLKTDALSLAFGSSSIPLTATSPEGPCSVIEIKAVKPADEGKVLYSGGELKTGSASAAASIAFMVNVDIPDYKALPEKSWPKITVKIVNTLPKLKLSQTSVTLAGLDDTPVSLLSADAKKTLESLGPIDKVTLNGGGADLYRHGMIYIPGEAKAGSHKLNVYFSGAAKAVDLNLTVKLTTLDKLTVSSAAKTIVVHKNHSSGKEIASVGLIPGAHNVIVRDWVVKGLPSGIDYTAGPNSVTLHASGPLTKTTKAVTLEINSPSMQFKTPVKISLSVTENEPGCTVSLKGKLDAADPKSKIDGTVKLTNTTSALEEIILTGEGSGDFVTEVTGANTFTISCGKGAVPGVKRTFSVNAVMKNGQTVKAAKTITVTPSQTVGKAVQSHKDITLYKTTPLRGSTVGLSLTTPQNVKLGDVRVNEASVAAMKFSPSVPNNGFEIKRAGPDKWTIHFKNGKAPASADGKALKASYNLKLELWAEGTYEQNADGSFKDCLRDASGNAKSKPKLVTVKVFIK